MKILELCPFSAGIDGVFARVKQESAFLAEKGHQVKIFSSNLTKGSDTLASKQDKMGNVEILRFPAKKLGGESFMSWHFEKEALQFKPDIIICHCYRHTHTTRALCIAKKTGSKVFLVTHAPFDRSSTRSLAGKIAVSLYDKFIGKKTLHDFTKIITITKWENSFLHKLGIKDNKIEYIPNGISQEFFTQKKQKEQHKVLFLGRISPIKYLETLVRAIPLVKDKKVTFELVGPAEEEYLIKLKELIKNLQVEDRVIFTPAIFETKEKIKKIDSAKIFILPSKSEGMPQSLIEAMAREKIVIASNNKASLDLIEDKKNGYIFPVGDSKKLAQLIDYSLSSRKTAVKNKALASVKKFSWKNIIEKIENLIKN